jgi:hypothetical protein
VSFYLNNLPRPDTRVYTPEACNAIAFELQGVAIAARDQATVWSDEGNRAGAAGMVEFAEKVQERARWFRFAAQRPLAKGE